MAQLSEDKVLVFNTLDMDQRTADWNAFRQHHIGSTDAAPIMGESPYKTRATLLREKLGLEPPEPMNDLMREGIALEPHARQQYERQRGLGYTPRVLQNQSYPWQVASVDGITTCRTRLLEIKCGKGTYWQTRRNGRPCRHYYAQLQHILCVTGLSSIDYFVYRPDQSPILLTVTRDPGYIERLMKAESEFYSELSQKLIAIGQKPKYSVTSSGGSPYKPDLVATTTSNVQSGKPKTTGAKSTTPANTQQEIASEPVVSFGEINYSDGRYVGETKNGLRHGTGMFTSSSGDKYVGEWKDGKEHGQGNFTYSDGARYVGEWKDGKWAGQGTFTFADGDKYVGEWKDGEFHGQGTCTTHRYKYVGEWDGSDRHGQGDCTYSDGDRYVGEWKYDKRHGQGTLTWPDGGKYVGEWKDDKRHGQGDCTYSDGGRYVGEWKDGNRNGQGTYTALNGYKYVGEWKDGKQHGQGKCTYSDGRRYVGKWKDGNRHGQGDCTNPDGIRYVGGWKDDKQHGRGTYTTPKGLKYVGDWENNRAHGRGDCVFENGARYIGEWRDNKRHGKGSYTWPDGGSYSGSFRDGKLNGTGKLEYADGQIYTANFISMPVSGRSPPAPQSGWKNLSDQLRSYGSTSWPDGRKYLGDLKFNVPHGRGEMSWSNGQKYSGEFRNGKKDGDGIIELPNGDKIVGKWKDDQPVNTRHVAPPRARAADFYLAGQAWAGRLNSRQRDHFMDWYVYSDASELPYSVDDACLDKNALRKLNTALEGKKRTRASILRFIKGAGDLIEDQL